MMKDRSVPMSFYTAYDIMLGHFPDDAIIINEGSSTMDIGRTVMPNTLPKHRYTSMCIDTPNHKYYQPQGSH